MNSLRVLIAFIAMSIPFFAHGQAIQVNDAIANATMTKGFEQGADASKAAGTQVATAIENQNKTLANIFQAMSAIETQNTKAVLAIAEKRQNADSYDPTMGAMAPTACDVYRATATIKVGDHKRQATVDQLKRASELHHIRAKYAHKGEAQNLGSAYRLINQMNQVDSLEAESGQSIDLLSSQTIKGGSGPETDLSAYVNKANNILNPFPVALPDDYNSPNQTPDKAIESAGKRVHAERMKLASGELSRHAADRIAVYDNSWIKDFISKTADGQAGQEEAASLDEFNSRIDSLRVLYKHRAESASWQALTGGSSNSTGLMRDQTLMQAQSLALQFDQYMETKRMNEQLALIYALLVEQQGVPKPNYE